MYPFVWHHGTNKKQPEIQEHGKWHGPPPNLDWSHTPPAARRGPEDAVSRAFDNRLFGRRQANCVVTSACHRALEIEGLDVRKVPILCYVDSRWIECVHSNATADQTS